MGEYLQDTTTLPGWDGEGVGCETRFANTMAPRPGIHASIEHPPTFNSYSYLNTERGIVPRIPLSAGSAHAHLVVISIPRSEIEGAPARRRAHGNQLAWQGDPQDWPASRFLACKPSHSVYKIFKVHVEYSGAAWTSTMGRTKKPFIDKKRSTTYNLVFEHSEAGADAQPGRRTYVEASKGVGVGRVDQEALQAAQEASGAPARRWVGPGRAFEQPARMYLH